MERAIDTGTNWSRSPCHKCTLSKAISSSSNPHGCPYRRPSYAGPFEPWWNDSQIPSMKLLLISGRANSSRSSCVNCCATFLSTPRLVLRPVYVNQAQLEFAFLRIVEGVDLNAAYPPRRHVDGRELGSSHRRGEIQLSADLSSAHVSRHHVRRLPRRQSATTDVCSVDDAPPNSTAWTGAASPPTRLSERMHDRIRTGALSILPSSS